MTGTAAWYFTTSRITLGIRWRQKPPPVLEYRSQWFLANSSCPRVMTHSGNKLSQKKREKRSLGKTFAQRSSLITRIETFSHCGWEDYAKFTTGKPITSNTSMQPFIPI